MVQGLSGQSLLVHTLTLAVHVEKQSCLRGFSCGGFFVLTLYRGNCVESFKVTPPMDMDK